MRLVFVKGETSGGLTASGLRIHRALAWEAKDLSSTLSLSLGPAWSKDLSLSLSLLCTVTWLTRLRLSAAGEHPGPTGVLPPGVSASALGPTPILPPSPQPGLLNPQEPVSFPRAE